MPVGSTYRLFIPSGLAYGPSGAGQFIGPDETLVFKIDLLGIVE
jgi:FKBP-type peptidyl-prolyl cis-trans isomerase